jgi:hypothetical protein
VETVQVSPLKLCQPLTAVEEAVQVKMDLLVKLRFMLLVEPEVPTDLLQVLLDLVVAVVEAVELPLALVVLEVEEVSMQETPL